MMDVILNNVVPRTDVEKDSQDGPIIFVQHRPLQVQPSQSRPIQPHHIQSPIRTCEFCGSSNTPTWRRGPAGKASLCNACGIKWRLRKRLKKGDQYPSSAERGKTTSLKLKKKSEAPNRQAVFKERRLMSDQQQHSLGSFHSPHIIERGRRKHYFCKYCKQTWAISHFKNSQQFGAHCSNCSRRPINGVASPMSDIDAMSDDQEELDPDQDQDDLSESSYLSNLPYYDDDDIEDDEKSTQPHFGSAPSSSSFFSSAMSPGSRPRAQTLAANPFASQQARSLPAPAPPTNPFAANHPRMHSASFGAYTHTPPSATSLFSAGSRPQSGASNPFASHARSQPVAIPSSSPQNGRPRAWSSSSQSTPGGSFHSDASATGGMSPSPSDSLLLGLLHVVSNQMEDDLAIIRSRAYKKEGGSMARISESSPSSSATSFTFTSPPFSAASSYSSSYSSSSLSSISSSPAPQETPPSRQMSHNTLQHLASIAEDVRGGRSSVYTGFNVSPPHPSNPPSG